MILTTQQQKIYARYIALPDGELTTGNSLKTEYKRGLLGHRSLAPRDGIAYAAWLAGRDKKNGVTRP